MGQGGKAPKLLNVILVAFFWRLFWDEKVFLEKAGWATTTSAV